MFFLVFSGCGYKASPFYKEDVVNSDKNVKEIASKILLTYTKATNGIVGINGENFKVESFENKEKIKEFMIYKG